MRISDWSSDVCSSDLAEARADARHRRREAAVHAQHPPGRVVQARLRAPGSGAARLGRDAAAGGRRRRPQARARQRQDPRHLRRGAAGRAARAGTDDRAVRDNCVTVPGSSERVEFAVKLPGTHADQPIRLPIDAKFPREDYERLMDAQDRADVDAVAAASTALERQVRVEARRIRAKYMAPPHTPDFALPFLPTQGLDRKRSAY